MQEHDRIGARVAALRKERGYNQRQLARRAHISYSLLTKVESGHAPASPAFIGAVARALRVDIPRITGQPYEEPSAQARLTATVAPLRRALLTWDLPSEDLRPRPVEELAADVRRISQLGRQARYLQLGQALPPLLAELSVAINASDQNPHLYALLAEAYGGVSALSHQLGYLDLRNLALDRVEWAARRSQDPLRLARTQWSRGASLLSVAAYDQGLRLMQRTRDDIGNDIGRLDAPALSVYGSLHLRSAVLAARSGQARGAEDHLQAAREIATLLPDDQRNHYGMEFGLSNVGIHAVSVAVELADGATALERARAMRYPHHALLQSTTRAWMNLPLPADIPPVRAGHHWMEIARAWFYQGDRRSAFIALGKARKASPQQVRHHPMVRDLTYAIAMAEPRPSEHLRSFMAWLGMETNG